MGASTGCVSCSLNPQGFHLHRGGTQAGTFFSALGRDLQCAPDGIFSHGDVVGDEEAHPWLTRTSVVSGSGGNFREGVCDGEERLVSRCSSNGFRGRSSKTHGGSSHNIVADFVRSLARGRVLSVANAAGGSTICTASLDSTLTHLVLQYPIESGNRSRSLPLQSVQQILVGVGPQQEAYESEMPMDELCVTLLVEGQLFSFMFDDDEERDAFALCLSLFVADAPDWEVTENPDWGTPIRHHTLACGLCH